VVEPVLMFWEGLLLQILKATKQSQNNKERLQSVSNSETDVTVNLSTFTELLMANDDGTKDQQKQVVGPQLRLGTEWRLRHA